MKMKKIYGDTKKRTLGLCMLIATLFGSAAAKADVVLDWNVIAVNTAVMNGQNPFAQARYAAIVQLAVFESVNAITGEYHPYLGTIAAPRDASPEAAAIQAAYRVLRTYFTASASTLDTERANSLASIPDGQAKTDGIATGEAAALAMIALRANDGSSPPQFKIPGPPVPGEWQATPSCPKVNGVAVGIAYQWQNITPFGISSVSEYLLDPPPVLTSHAYAKAYNEVMTVGGIDSTERPQDRANVALFYAAAFANSGLQSGRPAGCAGERWHSLTENARALALMNMATNDSLKSRHSSTSIAYNFWRPETVMRSMLGTQTATRKPILIPTLSPLS